MDDIITWLTKYSPPIVFLLVIGAIFIYLVKLITEKTISNEFDKHKKVFELDLEKRSNFEEKILMDRYLMIRELQTKIGIVLTNLKRVKNGTKLEGFIVNNDIVPLTEVFESLAVNKYLITDKFHRIFWEQSQIALQFANETNEAKMKELGDNYLNLVDELYKEMNEMFELDKIKWRK
ncbi:hypothetical protein [Solitalea canadensis]|uniref:Uncharacterized protein n=1 Tax=Solitalea canadensis (strain ATCC 29591 / DSM 3403 / JCM 21819 / LMG 8368 / NBRC 15130 / NCIMB 12057 / USAM 9D) TaxID=929556 RepID=H8KQ04_SOLCM|nr:hypothetical protein [Solitalea canadensis]AFD06113.1 hypothetical protein Solca_1005 [Solitalea canadensis DSM 3403]